MTRSIYIFILLYAVFLLVIGLYSYSVNPHLYVVGALGGVGGGFLMFVMSMLIRKKVQWAFPATYSAIGVFTLSFVWRAGTFWYKYYTQQSTDSFVATIVTVLFIGSALLALQLYRSFR